MPTRNRLPDAARLDPAQSLEPALAHARRFYARALAELSGHLEAAQGDDAAAWRLLFERVAHDAVWAATELHRGVETKYFRQRYISARAYRHWAGASTRGECGRGVQHEHVVELREIKQQLARAGTEADFHETLSRALACVVTDQDHADLNRQGKPLRGWQRYEQAGIAVWDRLEGRWHLAPAAGSDTVERTAFNEAVDPAEPPGSSAR